MHVVIFGDQHLESSGGAQVSARLQRRFLERAGHVVTVVTPSTRGSRDLPRDPAYVETPSIPVTLDREYAMTWPGRGADAFVDRALAERPPVDVVHVQGDFWGAFLGHRFARRHGLALVQTMHNRVDAGIRAVSPAPGATLRALNLWQRRALRPVEHVPRGADGWSYLAGLAAGADAVTAPSAHFARRLEQHGVFPGVDVVWNGIDDDALDAALASRGARAAGLPRLVWIGRMSPEKRLLPFLHAVAESGVRAEVEVIGGGAQLRAARRLVETARPAASVVFSGRLPYATTLERVAAADAVVQTSVGFETQGMTVFEAAALGTPSVVSDPDIAAELGSGLWRVDERGLAAALRTAVRDIEAGASPEPDASIAERFRQSSRTAAMVEVYRRAIG